MFSLKTAAHEQPAPSHSNERETLLVIVAVAMVAFLGILSETALNIAYAILMNDFSVTVAEIQWLTTGYLLVLSLLIPLSPMFVKTMPTKALFQTAVIVFFTGTAFCAFTAQFTMLFLGRIIQALGTGLAFPLMMNLILEKIPVAQRGKVMGVVGGIVNFAPALGPAFGGLMIQWFNWHWIFISMLPILVIAFWSGSKYIPDIHSHEKLSIDLLSVLLSTVGFVGIVYGVSQLAEYSQSAPLGLSYILAGGLSLAGFAFRQLKLAKPLIEVRLFANPVFTIGVAIVMISMMSVLAAGFVLPLYIQKSLGYSGFAAAMAMLPGAVVNGVMAPVAGRFYDRYGPILLLAGGFLLLLVTQGIFSFWQTDLSTLTLVYTVFMFGASLLAIPAQTNSLNQLPRRHNPDGTAIIGTLQQVSGAVGTTLASGILTLNSMKYLQAFPQATAQLTARAVAFGVQRNFLLFGVLAALGFGLAFFTRADQPVFAAACVRIKK